MRAWFWWGNQKERDYLDDTGVEGRIILRRYCGSRKGAMD
jgi:hypothetical protein